jgi:hypothetical protein
MPVRGMSSMHIFSISGQLVQLLKEDTNISHVMIGKARKESRVVMCLWVHATMFHTEQSH